MQVSSKMSSINEINTNDKKKELDLILKRVQQMKEREDLQRQIRNETLQKNLEFNLKHRHSLNNTESLDLSIDEGGLHKIF